MNDSGHHERQLDVVVWGATGFTGRLVAQHLMRTYGVDGEVRWAIAGRNREKLERKREALRGMRPSSDTHVLPIIIADSADRESLRTMARRTRVVCSTVGPFARHGSHLVAVCAETGTDYCDTTGEVQWVRRMIDAFDAEAARNSARIVHCCGFDSIPSDLGCHMLQTHAQQRHGSPCSDVRAWVVKARGAFSGGTIASILTLIEEASGDRHIRRILADPYALNPPERRSGPPAPDLKLPAYDTEHRRWTAPFLMAPVNTRVVRRTNALLDNTYGDDFRYSEAVATGGGMRGLLTAATVSAAMTGFPLAASNALLRRGIRRLVPQPGTGPTALQRDRGFFQIELHGQLRPGAHDQGGALNGERLADVPSTPEGGKASTPRPQGNGPIAVRAVVRGDSDPGYGATSKMVGEAAVCLAKDRSQLTPLTGILTPAAAMGHPLLARLRARAGMEMKIVED